MMVNVVLATWRTGTTQTLDSGSKILKPSRRSRPPTTLASRDSQHASLRLRSYSTVLGSSTTAISASHLPLSRGKYPMADRIDPTSGAKLCPPGGSTNPCDSFTLARPADSTYMDNVVASALQLGGAPLNVYRLLGITSINDPQNVTGRGVAISSPSIPGFGIDRVFASTGPFRSAARGFSVQLDAFVGYDFGSLPLEGRPGAQRYSERIVSLLSLDQSSCLEWTASRVRIERSDDGVAWVGVAIVATGPGAGTYTFASSTAARYWRIRPVEFRGATDPTAFWEVTSLFFGESGVPELSNIEDHVLFENRAREYDTTPIQIKGTFTHQDSMLELMAHGMGLTQQLAIEVSFSQVVGSIGRPLVVGDIIEMPTEVMYDPNLQPVRKFVEVMDVAWSATSYTAGWLPTMLRVMVSPAVASRETKDIFGATHRNRVTTAGEFERSPALPGAIVQDYDSIVSAIRGESRTAVPKLGIDQSATGEPTLAEQQAVSDEAGLEAVAKFIKPQQGAYVEDALPPNGEPYTTSAELPPTGVDGAYHRVIYTGAAKDIPARLYRYSGVKGRWIYLESDKRSLYGALSPMVAPKTLK